MKLALLIAWLLVGVVDSDWLWDNNSSDEASDVMKMDGPEEQPPKP